MKVSLLLLGLLLGSAIADPVPREFKATPETTAAIAERKEAVQLFEGLFMRDPYILLGPDGSYYYTCTRLNDIDGGDPNDYGTQGVELWKSDDLANWKLLDVVHRFADLPWREKLEEKAKGGNHRPLLWAPEIHHFDGKWYLVYTTSVQQANILVADQATGPYRELFKDGSFGHHHDPTMFQDSDGRNYLIDRATTIQEMNKDWSAFIGKARVLQPSDRKIGHEGSFLMKLDKKYVLFGTAWSTDTMRHGSYNLYYTTSDSINGPWSERKFVGRFLGHCSPFFDKKGNLWPMSFHNGTTIPFEKLSKLPDQGKTAHTLVHNGAWLVPMTHWADKNNEIRFQIHDSRFAKPGPEEVQSFSFSDKP